MKKVNHHTVPRLPSTIYGLLLVGLLAVAPLCAQITPIPHIQTQELDVLYPLTPTVSGVAAQVIGGSGSSTFYYWVIANYPAGNSAPVSAVVTNAPAAFTSSNYARVTWQLMSGASSYDLLRTTTSTTPSGTSNIAVATGLAVGNQGGNSYNDVGNALTSYTVNTAPTGIACTTTSSSYGCSGSGASNVQVNGGATLATANFNNSTPAASAGFANVLFQNSGSSVSAEYQETTCNQTTVICPNLLTAYTGFSDQVNAARTTGTCATASLFSDSCTIDLRGYSAPTISMPTSVYLPEAAAIIVPQGNIVEGCGAVLWANHGDHIFGMNNQYAAEISKSCGSADYSPTIGSLSPQVYSVEINNMDIQATGGANGTPVAVTGISAAGTYVMTLGAVTAPSAAAPCNDLYDGPCAVYTVSGNGIANPSQGQQILLGVVIAGYSNAGNNGTFNCAWWTSSTLTCYNSGAVAETPGGSPTATLTTATWTFSSTQSGAGSNAWAGFEYASYNPQGLYDGAAAYNGYFMAVASTTSNITMTNIRSSSAVAQAGYIVKMGNWAVTNIGGGSTPYIHQSTLGGTGGGIKVVSGSSYMSFRNLNVHGGLTALYLGGSSYTMDGENQISNTGATSIFPSIWAMCSGCILSGLNIENGSTPLYIGADRVNAIPVYTESDRLYNNTNGNPTVILGHYAIGNTIFPGWLDVLDYSAYGTNANSYGRPNGDPFPLQQNLNASTVAHGLADPSGTSWATNLISSGSGTSYPYAQAFVDINGHTTNVAFSTVSNGTLGVGTGVNQLAQAANNLPLGTHCVQFYKQVSSTWYLMSFTNVGGGIASVSCVPSSMLPEWDDGTPTLAAATLPAQNETAWIDVPTLVNSTYAALSVTSYTLGCFNSGYISSCGSTNYQNFVGVLSENQGDSNPQPFVYQGKTLAAFHSATAVTVGDIICPDGTNYKYVIDNGSSACTTGPQVGIVPTTNATPSTTQTIVVTRGPFSAGGSGTVNSGTATHLGYYASTGTAISDAGADLVFNGTHTYSSSASLIFDLSAASGTAAFKVPVHSGNTATAAGVIDFDSTSNHYHVYDSGADDILCTKNNGQCTGSGTLNAEGSPSLNDFSYWFDSTHVQNLTPTTTGLTGVPIFHTYTPGTGHGAAPSGVVTNAQTGTTYTYLNTDRAGYTSFSNASSIAATLPQAGSSGFGNNWVNRSCDIGAGTVTITPTTSTISWSNGVTYSSAQASMTLTTGQCATIYSDNSNYFAVKEQLSALGTPTSLTLTNATGLPISTGVSGLGTGVATALGVNTGSAGAFSVLIASGTSAMGTGAISSGTCASAVTTSASGVAATDVIAATPNTDPTGVTGYAPSASGSLYIQAYPTSGNVNFKVCNNTSGSITPGALTLNWRVTR